MPVQIRPARVGDGDGMTRVWLTAGAYYADLDPAPRCWRRPSHGDAITAL
jgi:hypothetical protein